MTPTKDGCDVEGCGWFAAIMFPGLAEEPPSLRRKKNRHNCGWREVYMTGGPGLSGLKRWAEAKGIK